jgi:hypothetical protein
MVFDFSLLRVISRLQLQTVCIDLDALQSDDRIVLVLPQVDLRLVLKLLLLAILNKVACRSSASETLV